MHVGAAVGSVLILICDLQCADCFVALIELSIVDGALCRKMDRLFDERKWPKNEPRLFVGLLVLLGGDAIDG